MRVDLRTTDYGLQTTDWRRRHLGFTLIELLVVIGLLMLTTALIFDFLTASLKSSNQTNVTAEVKQNGQAVLDSLDRQIRSATKAVAITGTGLPTGASSGVNLTLSGGNSLYLACFNSTATTNGWIGVASVLTGTDTSVLANYKSVTNTDTVSGVDISDSANPPGCRISVIAASGGIDSPDVVSFEFTANQGITAPSRQDFQANAKFQTTISLRQY